MQKRSFVVTACAVAVSSLSLAPGCSAPDGALAGEGVESSSAAVDVVAPKAHRVRGASSTGAPIATSSLTNGIDYHGGPVMTGTVNVYYIWYGNWGTNTAKAILPDFMNGLNGSAYLGVNTTYYDGSFAHTSGRVQLNGQVNDAYSRGTALSDADIQTIVASHAGHDLPLDGNGIYFVLTTSDVNEVSGFCTAYCGWHTHATIAGVDLKYSFVGNPDRCPTACEAQQTGPNGNPGADGMASIIAHEAEETISDPALNAWFDASGNENGDKCAWNFGAQYTAANGARANVRLGSRDFLIQQNWSNAIGGSCAMGICGFLLPGQSLTANQTVTSCDGRYTLAMQGDGNLVLYHNGVGALWATGTQGTTGRVAAMQGDGNFVLYDASGRALWNSGTQGHSGATLSTQSDGNLVVYQGNTPLWSTGTQGR